MKKLLLILSCVVVVGGCRSALKSTWGNFRAYYNTYYNAEKNYRTGLKKVHDQPVTLDPREPVRIHPAPVQAGNSDFDKAIDKGAKILRKFPDSKWADDALLLIGKSYYYRQEFYPALQKFEELRNVSGSPKMKQCAIIWKGRTQLDLNLIDDGVAYLESELDKYPEGWAAAEKGEIQALAAEHHAMLENWQQAADLLALAVSEIEDNKLLGRTLFLYGQMLERLERYGEAYFAFSKVSEHFPGFEYTYWARFKQADVARQDGNLQLAISIYENLRKDDKNIQRRGELTYQIARTLEMEGDPDEAEKMYKSLLYSDRGQQIQNFKSDIYYRLGKIYSDQYSNYPVAAAYFDSSSSLINTAREREDSRDVQILADAFGKYTQLQKTIQRADSLLWLGNLSQTELDSALARIRMQRRNRLLAQREGQAEPQNMLANQTLSQTVEPDLSSSSSYGFLNYRNQELASRSKSGFRIIWGKRPLIDNWRRMEVVRQSGAGRRAVDDNEEASELAKQGGEVLELDLSEIPRTAAEKDTLKLEKMKAQYELGNVLFLNLNLPDSARHYYHRVIKSEVGRELRPRAMYSLFELFSTSSRSDSVRFWAERILEEYPESRYARRVRNRLAGTPENEVEPDSLNRLIDQYQQIISSPKNDIASRLRRLALANRSSELAPYIHYKSIEIYINQAKAFAELEDSVFASPVDTLFPAADSTANVDVSMRSNPPQFNGAYWDSVRQVVQEFDTTFSSAKQLHRVRKLQEMLGQTDSLSSNLPTCEQFGITLSVKPSMEAFLSTVVYPDKLKDVSLSGEVVYLFEVNGAGKILSYELVSKKTSLGIEKSFERTFDQSLEFEPLKMEDPPPKIRCEVTFPIQE